MNKLYQVIGLFLSTKIMFWAYPDSKRFIKGIIIGTLLIILTIYFHNEYINWAEITDNKSFIGTSYIIKNLIILFLIVVLFLYLKKPPIKKNNKVKIKGEEKIYTKNKKEDYFDKFRNKDKLKTKAERLLERDGKK